jgi:hypothetical protein
MTRLRMTNTHLNQIAMHAFLIGHGGPANWTQDILPALSAIPGLTPSTWAIQNLIANGTIVRVGDPGSGTYVLTELVAHRTPGGNELRFHI